MDDLDTEVRIAAMEACLWLLLIIGAPIVHGACVSQLWEWFVVPTFSAPSLSVAVAIGLTLIFRTVAGSSPKRDADGDSSAALEKAFGSGFFAPLLGLALGWIVYQFT